MEAGRTSYYLSEDHKMIKMHNLSRVKIYDGERRHTLDGPPLYFRPLFEIEGCVYVRTFLGIFAADTGEKGQFFGWCSTIQTRFGAIERLLSELLLVNCC